MLHDSWRCLMCLGKAELADVSNSIFILGFSTEKDLVAALKSLSALCLVSSAGLVSKNLPGIIYMGRHFESIHAVIPDLHVQRPLKGTSRRCVSHVLPNPSFHSPGP